MLWPGVSYTCLRWHTPKIDSKKCGDLSTLVLTTRLIDQTVCPDTGDRRVYIEQTSIVLVPTLPEPFCQTSVQLWPEAAQGSRFWGVISGTEGSNDL